MRIRLKNRLGVIASILALSGCASTSSNTALTPATDNLASASPIQRSAPHSQTSRPEVPRLKVLIACSDCTIPETVPGLMMQGYNDAAAQSGVLISSKAEATLSITRYTQRPPAKRAFLGILAGKDAIKAVVAYKGKKFEVEDYYVNAWQGMNSLSRRIGELAFEKLKPETNN